MKKETLAFFYALPACVLRAKSSGINKKIKVQAIQTLILPVYLLLLAITTQAQITIVEFTEPEEWKSFIMDGDNLHHVWARQTDPTRLAIGLMEGEGYISMENDSCFWLRGRDNQEDELFATCSIEPVQHEYLFRRVAGRDPESLGIVDTLGSFIPHSGALYDKNNNLLGIFESDGNITDPQTNQPLLKTREINPVLSTFFFLSFYQEQRKLRSLLN